MKKIFIFALMTMAASSSFAFGISDLLKCSNGRVTVETYRHINDANLRLSVSPMIGDPSPIYSIVKAKSSGFGGEKTFTGRTVDGHEIKFEVKKEDSITGTLTINGSAEEGLGCYEQPRLGM